MWRDSQKEGEKKSKENMIMSGGFKINVYRGHTIDTRNKQINKIKLN